MHLKSKLDQFETNVAEINGNHFCCIETQNSKVLKMTEVNKNGLVQMTAAAIVHWTNKELLQNREILLIRLPSGYLLFCKSSIKFCMRRALLI